MALENPCSHTTHLAVGYPEGVKFLHRMTNEIEGTLEGRGPVFAFSPSRFEVFFGSYGESIDNATADSDERVEIILGHLGLWAETIETYTIKANELRTEEEFTDYLRQLNQNPNYDGADVIPLTKPKD
ncbi:MAG TPA: hypothetical protein VMR34_05055 [Candidatus Saccharimonadales bacterium]|nr:hypothetical protein [Candidatus Saccharimonadales bacterium]